jgi:pyruvate/2-oxoglutarate dehydrogenase complex dihydrolipoamide dehydrogenase (E3) component
VSDPQTDSFEFVIIGAGAAGEAAVELARDGGYSAAIIDRDLYGGSCAFWACMPSKSLLHAAAVHHAGGDYPWQKASDFRDWMISREDVDYPSDASHQKRYRDIGAEPIRGTARLDGPGGVRVELTDGGSRELKGDNIIIAVGSHSRIPDIVGLDQIDAWDNRLGTGTRSLPKSLLVMGGGPTGVELAQVYARYGVPVTLVDSNPRILARDHSRNSELVSDALEDEGVRIRTGVRAVRVEPGAGRDGAHVVRLSDGSKAEGHEVLVSIGRAIPFEDLGLETIGITAEDRMPRPDDQLRIAPGVYVVGDPAGPELHTHLAHYQGEMAVRIARGEDVRPDYRAIPRALYTQPEVASVGLLLEQALEAGHDAFEATADLYPTAKGYTSEARGHITIVVDRGSRTLLGVFIGGPGASELIHEAVLAVKLRVPLVQLADTIHAFPTVARVMGNLFVQVHRELDGFTRPAAEQQ